MRRLAFALSVLPALSGPVRGEPGMLVRSMTPDDVVALLRSGDVQAALPTAPTHRPAVQARLAGQRGMVFLFDCQGVRCGSLKFVATLDGAPKYDLAFLNTWNSRRRYVSAYLHEGQVFLYQDIDLRGGIATAGLARQVKMFEFLVRDFLTFTP